MACRPGWRGSGRSSTNRTATSSGVWFNDGLAPQISPGGRLAGLLNAGSDAEVQSPLGHNPTTRNVPVTWAIDPMLVTTSRR